MANGATAWLIAAVSGILLFCLCCCFFFFAAVRRRQSAKAAGTEKGALQVKVAVANLGKLVQVPVRHVRVAHDVRVQGRVVVADALVCPRSCSRFPRAPRKLFPLLFALQGLA